MKIASILVTGGAGFLGSHIVARLLAQPEVGPDTAIRCMTRNPAGRSHPDPRVSFVAGDVRDAASLERATEGADAVVHCVQFPNHPVENPSRGYTYIEIDARGTERLVAACQKNGVRRIVYLSGAGTSPERPETWFQAKVIAERAVRDSGIDYVILRPSWVFGPEDRSLNRFVSFIKYLPVVPVIGDGSNRVQIAWVGDVAEMAARAVFLAAATNRTFDVGGPQTLTMDEIVATVQRVLGTHRLVIHQPAGLMKLAARPLQILPSPPLSPAAVDFVLMAVDVDPKPAAETFGVALTSLEDGLRTYLAR